MDNLLARIVSGMPAATPILAAEMNAKPIDRLNAALTGFRIDPLLNWFEELRARGGN